MSWERLKTCSNSFEGRERLFFSGMLAKYVRPKTFPAIYVNGEDDSARRQQVIDNMIGVICELYTGTVSLPECASYKKTPVTKPTQRQALVEEEFDDD